MCEQMCGTSGRTVRDRRSAEAAARAACDRRGGAAVTSEDYRAAAVRLRNSATAIARHGQRVELARLALLSHASVCEDLADGIDLDALTPPLFDLAG